MKLKTFDECCMEVRKSTGTKHFSILGDFKSIVHERKYYQQAAELYARQAVLKDRDRVFGEFNILHDHDQITGLAYMNHLSDIQEHLSIELA